MCKESNDKLSHYVLHLPRKDCRLLVGIPTGQFLAASHATTLRILNSRTCRKCDESGALSRARRRYVGAPVLASLGDLS